MASPMRALRFFWSVSAMRCSGAGGSSGRGKIESGIAVRPRMSAIGATAWVFTCHTHMADIVRMRVVVDRNRLPEFKWREQHPNLKAHIEARSAGVVLRYDSKSLILMRRLGRYRFKRSVRFEFGDESLVQT